MKYECARCLNLIKKNKVIMAVCRVNAIMFLNSDNSDNKASKILVPLCESCYHGERFYEK